MNCSIQDLRNKEVICIKDGTVLGCVDDVEINTKDGCLVAIIIKGGRGLAIFGKCDDIIIPWDAIEVIGDDTILVSHQPPRSRKKSGKFNFGGFLG